MGNVIATDIGEETMKIMIKSPIQLNIWHTLTTPSCLYTKEFQFEDKFFYFFRISIHDYKNQPKTRDWLRTHLVDRALKGTLGIDLRNSDNLGTPFPNPNRRPHNRKRGPNARPAAPLHPRNPARAPKPSIQQAPFHRPHILDIQLPNLDFPPVPLHHPRHPPDFPHALNNLPHPNPEKVCRPNRPNPAPTVPPNAPEPQIRSLLL
jgi:hypothetical protein